jgi:hypothetical protein
MFAQQAMSLAEIFQISFGLPVGKAVKFKPELAAPDGPSTGGGKQAVQAIKLTPVESGSATLVIGHANQIERTVELRTYEYLVRVQAQRFKGVELALEREPYDEFLKKLHTFFDNQSMRVSMVAAPPATGAEAAATPGKSAKAAVIAAIAVGGAVVLGAVAFWMRRAGH